jgi:hypothetical protein
VPSFRAYHGVTLRGGADRTGTRDGQRWRRRPPAKREGEGSRDVVSLAVPSLPKWPRRSSWTGPSAPTVPVGGIGVTGIAKRSYLRGDRRRDVFNGAE